MSAIKPRRASRGVLLCDLDGNFTSRVSTVAATDPIETNIARGREAVCGGGS